MRRLPSSWMAISSFSSSGTPRAARWRLFSREMTETTVSSSLKAVLHGVLVSIEGTGVLITGEAASGKSECALELVVRHGQRLIADDVVEIMGTDGALFGSCAPGMGGLLNVRDLGVLNVGHPRAALKQRIDLIIQLESGREDRDGRFPVDDEHQILGVHIPRLKIHNCHTRNLALLVQTAAARVRTAGTNIER